MHQLSRSPSKNAQISQSYRPGRQPVEAEAVAVAETRGVKSQNLGLVFTHVDPVLRQLSRSPMAFLFFLTASQRFDRAGTRLVVVQPGVMGVGSGA